MHGDAVHRRRHAHLAHAVMHVAAGEIARLHLALALGLGVVRRGQVGRAADQLGHRSAPAHRAPRPRPGASPAWRSSRGNPRRCRRSPCRDRPAIRRPGGAGIPRACPASSLARRLSHAWRAAAPRAPTPRHHGAHILGDDKGRVVPAEPLARALDLLGAERRAVRRGGAGLGRRAEGDDRPAGDEARPVLRLRPFERGGDLVVVVAVDALGRPAMRREALELVVATRRGWSAPSIVIELSSHSTISLLSLRCPASDIASWLIPSIRQPSPQNT